MHLLEKRLLQLLQLLHLLHLPQGPRVHLLLLLLLLLQHATLGPNGTNCREAGHTIPLNQHTPWRKVVCRHVLHKGIPHQCLLLQQQLLLLLLLSLVQLLLHLTLQQLLLLLCLLLLLLLHLLLLLEAHYMLLLQELEGPSKHAILLLLQQHSRLHSITLAPTNKVWPILSHILHVVPPRTCCCCCIWGERGQKGHNS
jgi:hypothetical protein